MGNLPEEVHSFDGAADGSPSREFVTISRAEFERLNAKVEAPSNEHLDSASQQEADSLTGWFDTSSTFAIREAQHAKELAARDERLAALELVCKAAIRDRELATFLSGKLLVPGGAAQLIRLWRDEFDVYEEDGIYKVSSRDGRAVSQVAGEWLSSPDYSHFCLPNSKGGTGARDTTRPASSGSRVEVPKNLGEAIVLRWREESASPSNRATKPIGLKRNRS